MAADDGESPGPHDDPCQPAAATNRQAFSLEPTDGVSTMESSRCWRSERDENWVSAAMTGLDPYRAHAAGMRQATMKKDREQSPAACYREAHNSPTSPRPRVAHHRKPTDETELYGTRRHGRYDGYNGR